MDDAAVEGGVFRISSDAKLGQVGSLTGTAGNTGTQTFVKSGAGTLELDGVSTFQGLTKIVAGALTGMGSIASALDVDAGATVSPGVSGVGTFTVGGNATVAGLLAVKVDPAGSGTANLLSVAGLLDLSAGTSTVDFSTLAALDDEPYVFATYGTLTGTFGSVTNLPAGYSIDYAYLGDSIALTTAVPEPATYAMALAGIACGGFSMWRRRKRA